MAQFGHSKYYSNIYRERVTFFLAKKRSDKFYKSYNLSLPFYYLLINFSTKLVVYLIGITYR